MLAVYCLKKKRNDMMGMQSRGKTRELIPGAAEYPAGEARLRCTETMDTSCFPSATPSWPSQSFSFSYFRPRCFVAQYSEMWLINTSTMRLEEFLGDAPANSYAILSHRWGKDEVTFQEFGTESCKPKAGFQEIRLTCEQATTHGIQYAWVDTWYVLGITKSGTDG